MQVLSEAMPPGAGAVLPRAGALLCMATLLGGIPAAQGGTAGPADGATTRRPADEDRTAAGPMAPAPPVTPTAVAEVTLSLLGFVRWPGDAQPIRLCLIGASPYADGLLQARPRWPRSGQRIVVRQRAPVDAARDCDALYLGRLPEPQRQTLQAQAAARGGLVISEHPLHCRQGGMVCLDLERRPPGFVVDAQALARSGVRLHPQVLALGQAQRVSAR